MKIYSLIITFLLATNLAYAQKISEMGLDKVRINHIDKTVVAEIKPTKNKIRIYAERDYYWYSANQVHYTQGGYGGRLLNGAYVEYYPDNSLKVYGYYKNGLKSGPWKNWNIQGKLTQYLIWNKGKEQGMVSVDDSAKVKNNKTSKPSLFKRGKKAN